MPFSKKIVLHCKSGYRPELDALIEQFLSTGVIYVGVVGPDASRIEDIIDEICVGDGTNPRYLLTANHEGESVAVAVDFANSLIQEYAGDTQVVEF